MIKTFSGKACAKGAKIALDHELFVNGWYLEMALKHELYNARQADKIAIKYLNDVPIGIVVFFENDNIYMAYVKPLFRRQGHGSEMLNAIRTEGVGACEGILGSDKFWRANKVRVQEFF